VETNAIVNGRPSSAIIGNRETLLTSNCHYRVSEILTTQSDNQTHFCVVKYRSSQAAQALFSAGQTLKGQRSLN
jgi:hypothetical protein